MRPSAVIFATRRGVASRALATAARHTYAGGRPRLRRTAEILWLPLLLAVSLPAPVRSEVRQPIAGASEVDGRSAKPFLKRPTGSFRAYAFHEGVPAPIPFQVDERDHRDHWADDAGPSPIRDETPGVFDENDVIVFMNRDLGTRGVASKLPAAASSWLEVRVGSEANPLGYAYLGSFDSPPALVAKQIPDYSHYDPKTDTVFADRYTVRFGGPLPSFLGLVRHQGEAAPNVLKTVRAQGEARILRGLFHFVRTEKDLRYEIQGYRDGPVRAIRSAKYWITLPLGFKARGKVELLFYADFVEARARLNIKIPPRFVPADGALTAYFDFADFAGARVLGPGGAVSDPVDGHMTDAKRAWVNRPTPWSALLLPDGRAFLLATRRGGSLALLDQDLYLDDSDDPGRGKPSFGFTLSGVSRLDTGEQELAVNAMILDSSAESDVRKAAAILLVSPPVAVTVAR